MGTFEDKVVIVTGGSSGIGRATAIAFAREGAKVVVSDVEGPGGEETVAQIRKQGGSAVFIRCDVSRADEVKAMVDRTIAEYKRLDCAFNNAGIEGVMAPLVDATEEAFDRIVAVNLKSVFLCMRAELPRLSAGGAIVNCSSIAGLVGFANAAAYSATKHGVIGLTRAAALEWAKKGVRVNAVCPGVIRTPMIDRATGGKPENVALYATAEPVGRLGEPDEIAAAVLWLCSPGASFTTGIALPVDGGWVAQ